MRMTFIFCTLILSPPLAGCGDAGNQAYQGYVEGEYVLIAAPDSGWLTRIAVTSGQRVSEGDLLFSLEDTRERAGRDAAFARLTEAAARLDNLLKGRRPEEISVIDQQIMAADANVRFAAAEYARQQQLAKTDVGARRKLEETRAAQRAAAARLEELRAQRGVALLPGREDEITAAKAAAAASQAQLAEAGYRLDQRTARARVGGVIEDIVRREGELVPAGGVVIAMLPPANVKLRFFIPETALAAFSLGKSVTIRCDSCPDNLTAKISFISSEAEFTPPVIYSVGNREKLVFLIEAKPSVYGAYLRPGLPVDVRLQP